MTGAPAHPDWPAAKGWWPNADASRFVRAGDAIFHVQRMGAGPAMLLLHGSGAATHSWRDLMPDLAASFDVVAPDLPGHGFTRAPPMATTLPGMAGATAALVRAMDIAPEIIVGHSAGAAVAIRMALDGAAAPRAVIGLNAALAPFSGIAGMLFPPMAKLLALNPLVPWAFSKIAASTGQARRIIEGTGSRIDAGGLAQYAALLSRPDHVGGALAMMARWDLDPLLAELPGLAVPLHLVVADGDRAVPPDQAERLARALPNVTLHRIAGYGHLVHEEAPEMVAALIRDIARDP